MKVHTKIYYTAADGTRFTKKEKCEEYERIWNYTDGFNFTINGEMKNFNYDYLMKCFNDFLNEKDMSLYDYGSKRSFLILGFSDYFYLCYRFETPNGKLDYDDEPIFNKQCKCWIKLNYNILLEKLNQHMQLCPSKYEIKEDE